LSVSGLIVLKQRMANSPQSISNMAKRPPLLSFIGCWELLGEFRI
jgi:hypothetical protein